MPTICTVRKRKHIISLVKYVSTCRIYIAYTRRKCPNQQRLARYDAMCSCTYPLHRRPHFMQGNLVTSFPATHALNKPSILLAYTLSISVGAIFLPEYAHGKCQAPGYQCHHQNSTQTPHSSTNNMICPIRTLLAAAIIIRESRKRQC